MCGIAGIFARRGRPSSELLRDMIAALRHRGPDAEGWFVDGPVGLAHARLSIIDLEGGGQPMSLPDGSLHITFNGEIYNYLELRRELEERGHHFRTNSDTELILHQYQADGVDCVHRLNGQWAFALWDRARRRLFLSRDRVGVRPLFYADSHGEFLFASEIKALLRHPALSTDFDLRALDQVFTYWSPLPPRTILRAVRQLPPGHSMLVEDAGITTWRYWNWDFPAEASTVPEAERAGALLDLLTEATRLRLRSDVPVAAYLSGGLDSTLTAALLRRVHGGRLATFSVCFDEQEFDESDFQRAASAALNTEHHQVLCTNADVARVFPDVLQHVEQPILRTAPAPMFLLSQLVRDAGYKVVVTGEGADEVLGGYDIFKETKLREFCARQPDSQRRPLLLKRLYPYLSGIQRQPAAYLRAFFHARGEDLCDPFFSHRPRWGLTARIKLLYSDALRAELRGISPEEELVDSLPASFASWSPFLRAQYLESAHLLPGYILSSQGDRVSMAHSLEGRFPFLDVGVIEFAARLPLTAKMKVLDEKHILKLAARGLVPEIIRRRSKQPYRAPDVAAFFDAAGKPRADYVEEALGDAAVRAAGLFDAAAVQALLAKLKRARTFTQRDGMALAGVLSTQLLAGAVLPGFLRRSCHAQS